MSAHTVDASIQALFESYDELKAMDLHGKSQKETNSITRAFLLAKRKTKDMDDNRVARMWRT
jgi:hypothetical protein